MSPFSPQVVFVSGDLRIRQVPAVIGTKQGGQGVAQVTIERCRVPGRMSDPPNARDEPQAGIVAKMCGRRGRTPFSPGPDLARHFF